jgi:glycine/D-amino acid oxidase-like deaminating enzyme
MLERLLGTFDDAHGVRLVDVRLGARPMPADGLPVVGPVPGASGAYVAVMHSGVTLAPVVGRLVATELVDGVDAKELHGVRPARFPARGLDARPASGPASMR